VQSRRGDGVFNRVSPDLTLKLHMSQGLCSERVKSAGKLVEAISSRCRVLSLGIRGKRAPEPIEHHEQKS
jgi:hypothetical protein